MKLTALLLAVSMVVVSCGVAGQPVKPKTTVKQTFGFNSRTGPFSKTSIGFEVSN